MSIIINKQACEKNGLTLTEATLLTVMCEKQSLEEAKQKLINNGYITADLSNLMPDTWIVTYKGSEVIKSIIADSDTKIENKRDLESLAKQLKEIYPKGKKEGTNYYWTDGTALVVRRLKLFFKKYGTTYTDEQIITATKKYVESFNSNYTYMKLFKYFVFKEKLGAAGDVEGESDLIAYIENAGQEETLNNNWVNTLR